MLHVPTSWQLALQPVTCPHASAEGGLGWDSNWQSPGQKTKRATNVSATHLSSASYVCCYNKQELRCLTIWHSSSVPSLHINLKKPLCVVPNSNILGQDIDLVDIPSVLSVKRLATSSTRGEHQGMYYTSANVNKAEPTHSDFETQRRCHQKLKTGVPGAPKIGHVNVSDTKYL